MKNILIGSVLLSVGLLSIGTGVARAESTSAAPNTYTYTKQHPYNFIFKFKGKDRHITNNEELQELLKEIMVYLENLLAELDSRTLASDINVTTEPATDIDHDMATLEGQVTEFDGSDYADVWFEYGQATHALSSKTSVERIAASDGDTFEETIDNLKTDITYHFRAVGQDDDGVHDYGTIRSFTTDDTDEVGELPVATTLSANDVDDDQATLYGQVHMHDYDSGKVFFVYGIDENAVDDVSDDYSTYSEVDEDSDNLIKLLVDSDLDTEASYGQVTSGLDAATEHFFRVCVEYENNDNEPILHCGLTLSFETES